MGVDIDRDQFTEAEFARFAERLKESLAALGVVVARPGFGTGLATIGAELEVCLVDGDGLALPLNDTVAAAVTHPRLTLETDRFNLECNTEPVALAGCPFSKLRAGLEDVLTAVRAGAAGFGGRVVAIGILPTLRAADLSPAALTRSARYRALSNGIRRLRQAPFEIAIDGPEPLVAACDDVTFEGANTSWQVHLKVPPTDFASTYNAAQVATAPVLAVAGNSPTFLGHRLWDETRVALYRQSVDERVAADSDDWRPARVTFGHGWVREGAVELFAESVAMHPPLVAVLSAEDPLAVVKAGGVPRLDELRLHQGTTWRWNRAVYDATDGGHLRIELRALPAGPTVVDMLANAAFVLGLTLALARDVRGLLTRLTFGQARRNFYAAARDGIDAELLWPTDGVPSPRMETVRALVPRLLPIAREGLVEAGVEVREVDPLLEVVAERTASGRTGARWQAAEVERLEARRGRWGALCGMLERYGEMAQSGETVCRWGIKQS
jgi:gamma-glutamyl:cysteine ligase YbdK (ATP-grasp superfamily)